MRRLKIVAIVFLSSFLFRCDFFTPIYSDMSFVFRNFTENSYKNTTISAVEIKGEKAIVLYVEDVETIYSRADYNGENTSNYAYVLTRTNSTEAYDEAFQDLYKSGKNKFAFLIELSDGQKLFIRVTYSHDPGLSWDSPSSYRIDITDEGIESSYESTEIGGVAVESFEIVR